MVSAVAGNVGLQSSNINTRALAVGLWSEKRDTCNAIIHELLCGIWCAVFMALVVMIISGLWFAKGLVQLPWHRRLSHGAGFGAVVGFAQFMSVITSVTTGAAAPLVFKRMGVDPATLAGPLETTVQDVLGYGTFMILGHILLPLIDPGVNPNISS